MSFQWGEVLKLSLVIGSLMFVIHAYYSLKLQTKRIDRKVNYTIDLLPGLHKKLWAMDSNLNRCLASVHNDTPNISCLLWLKTADGFNKMSQDGCVKDALKEALSSFKIAHSLESDDLNEIHDILKDLDQERHKFELESINNEIKRISNA